MTSPRPRSKAPSKSKSKLERKSTSETKSIPKSAANTSSSTNSKPKTKTKPKTIDAYLAALRPEQRAALEHLRNTIKSAAPQAEECITYGIAAFRQDGMLVAFGARANHCSLYPWNSTTVEEFKNDLAGYETSPGTIRFRADRPLPDALVRKLVKARLAENQRLRGKRK